MICLLYPNEIKPLVVSQNRDRIRGRVERLCAKLLLLVIPRGILVISSFTGVFTDGLSILIQGYQKNGKITSHEYLIRSKCHKTAKKQNFLGAENRF